jgi:site-specific recombinase XerD
VDWNTGVVRVRPETSKVRRLRYVPLGPNARQALFEYASFQRGASPHPSLFLNELGMPLGLRGIQVLLKRTAKRAGLKKLNPRMLRHTYATQALLGGAPLPFVQMVMGHTNLATTSIYLNQTQIQEAVSRQKWTPADMLGR